MFIMLNKSDVIIDIVETVKPVKINKNGITILCGADEAQGYIGSDNETIYSRMGYQFNPTFYDIAKMYMVDVPKGVNPLTHKYTVSDGFTENEDAYPDTNFNLTAKNKVNKSDISDTRDGLMETYEATALNESDIADLREAVMELYEMIGG